MINPTLRNEAKINEAQDPEVGDEEANNSIHLITQWSSSGTLEEFRDDLGDNYTTVGTDVYDTERWVMFTQQGKSTSLTTLHLPQT